MVWGMEATSSIISYCAVGSPWLFQGSALSPQVWVAWAVVNLLAIILTIVVHHDVMEIGHLLVHFGWRPEDLCSKENSGSHSWMATLQSPPLALWRWIAMAS